MQVGLQALQGSTQRSPVGLDHLPGCLARLTEQGVVLHQAGHDLRQLVGAGYLEATAAGDHPLGDIREVLHVRPEENRPAVNRRLEDVVAALGNQTTADEDDPSTAVQPGELSQSVQLGKLSFIVGIGEYPGRSPSPKEKVTS